MDKVAEGVEDSDKIAQGVEDLSVKESDEKKKENIKTEKEGKEPTKLNPRKIFDIDFEKRLKTISDNIKCIEEEKVDQNELPEHFRKLQDDIYSSKTHLAVNTSYLTNYTISRGMQRLGKLEKSVAELKEKLLPRKKFAFKKRNKSQVKKPTKLKDEVDNSVETNSATINVKLFSVSCGFSDKKNESLKLCNDEIAKNDVELRNLENCVVFLCGAPGTVHISDITGCKILCGPVSTSVFIENCSDSDIVVACQQLRIHSTNDSRFYIHVTSRAVIEDSRMVQFAPYNLEYGELETHFEHSGLNKSLNNWDAVDDFNWLVRDVHSPNWSLINPEERVLNWLSFIN